MDLGFWGQGLRDPGLDHSLGSPTTHGATQPGTSCSESPLHPSYGLGLGLGFSIHRCSTLPMLNPPTQSLPVSSSVHGMLFVNVQGVGRCPDLRPERGE